MISTFEAMTALGFRLPDPVPFPDAETWGQHQEALTAALIDDVLNGGFTPANQRFDDYGIEEYES